MIRRFPRPPSRTALALAYVQSAAAAARQRRLFAQVQTYCMFIGYPRSGHSLVGSLLDAHPEIVIAHELDALGFLDAHFTRNQIYALILNNAREIAGKGRQQTGYDYVVPDSFQGRFARLRVIGDKRGGTSTTRLRDQPDLVERLIDAVGTRVAFVHVTRNPFDNITTMAKRRSLTLEDAADEYFERCETVADVKRRVSDSDVIDVRHEDLIADSNAALKRLCEFFDVEATSEYLAGCASILFSSPHKTRNDAPWTEELKASVRDRAARYRFLDGYGWDS